MNPAVSPIPHLDFAYYLEFGQHLMLFFVPAAIGVLCSNMIKEFKSSENSKKMNFLKKFSRIVAWATPAAFIVSMIDIFVGPRVSDTVRLIIFGATFFVGMVGEELANMFINIRIWFKICKEILKDLGEAIGKIDFGKKISDVMIEELCNKNDETKSDSTSDKINDKKTDSQDTSADNTLEKSESDKT